MKESFIIKSANDRSKLEIAKIGNKRSLEYLSVTLDAGDFKVSSTIYNSYADDDGGLIEFFETLAKNWRGWEGKKVWESLECDLKLTCEIDSLGHVSMLVRLQELYFPISGGTCRVEFVMSIDNGQLDVIARDVKEFFKI